jgi:RNA polymerase sigma factor (sigma-70 family)
MSRAALDTVLHYARSLAGGEADQPEPLLLERFLARREEAAFAALVERHGPMVLGVCRRVLGNAADADDAFQATFLVLARQAAALRKRASLASWLYGIACRVAMRARTDAARRRLHERRAQALRPTAAEASAACELRDVLGEELARLPEKYRLAVVLCHLEGRTNEEAARQLGWPVGSVKGRLARARELLRARLTRRGFAPSAALLGTALAAQAADAVPPGLAQATLRAALATGLGLDAEGVSVSVAALAEGALRPAAWGRLKLLLAVLLVLAAAGSAGALLQGGTDPRPPKEAGQPPAEAPSPPGALKQGDLHGDPLPPGVSARLGTVRFRQAGQINALAYSADGKMLASGGQDRDVALWDAATGRRLRTFPGHGRWTVTLAISPNGKLLASGGYDGNLRLSELATGKEVRSFKGHWLPVNSVAFTPDSKFLASAGGDGRLVLWDVATGQVVRELMKATDPTKPANALGCLALSPDGKSLAVCAHDSHLYIWEIATGKERFRLRHPGGKLFAAAFSPDGKLLASGNYQDIRLWEAASGKLRSTWPDPSRNVHTLAFSPDGQMLAVISWVSSFLVREPRSIWLLNVDTGREVRRLENDTGSFCALAFAPDGRTLAVADDAAVRRWDTTTGKELPPHGGHRGAVFSVAVSADGRAVYSGGGDATLRRWDAATGKEVRRFVGHRSTIWRVRLTPDGKLLGSGGHDGKVYLWDPDGPRPTRELPAHSEFRALALAPDGRTLATSADRHGIRIWDAAGKELRKVAPEQLFYSLAFAPDGKLLASGGQDRAGYQRLQIWNVATSQEVGSAKGLERFSGLAFSPDGRWVATSHWGKDPVRLYDDRAREIRRFQGHRGSAYDVAFAPGGWMLASAGEDHTVRLWEVATGRERRRLEGHTGAVYCVAISADGRTLVSGGADTTVLVWKLGGAAREQAKGRLTPADLDKLWSELAGEDAARAYDAICRLSAFPGQAVPLLRERLLGGKAAAGPVGQWIRELDDPQFAVREKASSELAKLGRQAEPELRRALADASPEARRRLERLLAALPGAGGKAHNPERLRMLRALELLDLIGTPEARRAVEAVARTRAGTALGTEAQAVLERLKKRTPAAPWPLLRVYPKRRLPGGRGSCRAALAQGAKRLGRSLALPNYPSRIDSQSV